MTDPSQQQAGEDEKLVSHIYQSSKQTMPPQDVDNAVLAMAKQQGTIKPVLPWWKKMQYQGAFAASILVFSFIYLLQPNSTPAPLELSLPPSASNSVSSLARSSPDAGPAKRVLEKSASAFVSMPQKNQQLMIENQRIIEVMLSIQAELGLSHEQILATVNNNKIMNMDTDTDTDTILLVTDYLKQQSLMKNNLSKILKNTNDSVFPKMYSKVLSAEEFEDLAKDAAIE